MGLLGETSNSGSPDPADTALLRAYYVLRQCWVQVPWLFVEHLLGTGYMLTPLDAVLTLLTHRISQQPVKEIPLL